MTHTSDGSRIYRMTSDAPRGESESSSGVEALPTGKAAEALLRLHRSSAAQQSDWFVMVPSAANSRFTGATWDDQELRSQS